MKRRNSISVIHEGTIDPVVIGEGIAVTSVILHRVLDLGSGWRRESGVGGFVVEDPISVRQAIGT